MVIRRLLCLLVVIALFSCGSKTPVLGAFSDRPLYERIGGKDAVAGIVDDFVERAQADGRMAPVFSTANKVDLKAKLELQICQLAAGPCSYTGKSMTTAHAGMAITPAMFDAFVDDFQKSLERFGVSTKEQGEIRELLAPFKPQIVTP